MAAGAGHLAGFYHAQVMIRDDDGYPMGILATPNAPVNGTEYHAYKITGPISATAPTPTRELATFRGGQTVLGQRYLGVSDFGSFDFTTSAMDEVLDALFGGASNDTTNFGTANVAGAPNTLNADLPQFILALTAGFQTSDGTNRFMTWFYPNVQIAPPGYPVTQDGGVNPNPSAFTVVPSTSTRTAQGFLFSATTMAVSENKDVVHRLRTDNPIAITTYVDDGIAPTFTLGYRPTNTEHAGAVNIFTEEGVIMHTGVSEIVAETGVVTITPANAGDRWVTTYETNFVAI